MFGWLKPKISKLSPAQALEQVQNDPSIILLDVRTPEEFQSESIVKSINIPLQEIEQICEIIPKKDQTIFVYCLSGMRSKSAIQKMQDLGYTQVFNLGGISGLPFERNH